MADEPSTAAEEAGGRSFFKELSSAAAIKALTPLLAAAATAGTTYLTRKTAEIWHEAVQPKMHEKGGVKPLAKEALENLAERLSGRPAQVVAELAERLGEGAQSKPPVDQSSTGKGGATKPEDSRASEPEPDREEERKQRQQRRQQRQKALQKSAST
jgi:hypothetical protein